MDTNKTNGVPVAENRNRAIHPRDVTDWRKRLASVSRYIVELEDCLQEARSIVVRQQKEIAVLKMARGANCPYVLLSTCEKRPCFPVEFPPKGAV